MSVIIIDADPIIYAAGFAAQKTTYEYVMEHDSKPMLQLAFADGNEALRTVRGMAKEGWTVVNKTAHVDAKDVGFARQAAKTQLSSIVRRCKEELGDENAAVEIYLSGPDNYRYRLATIAPYKADRPPPPVHYQGLRDYLTQRWSAVVVSGMEADDKVSIRCRQLVSDGTPVVLATIDKDLDQVPCRHYGYKDKVFYDVSEEEADLVFWKQVISGDSTDNIPGCYKIGVAKAERLISDFQTEPYTGPWLVHVWDRIVDTYAENMAQYPERFPKGMLPYDAALETARLVWMQEYEGALWNPPGVPYGEVSSLAPVR